MPERTVRPRNLTAHGQRREATDAERRLWRALRDSGMPWKFRRQHPIGRHIADFACPERGLAIELDGGQPADQSEADAARSAEIAAYGYRVIRFWNNEVIENLDGVLQHLRQVLVFPPPHPGPPHTEGRRGRWASSLAMRECHSRKRGEREGPGTATSLFDRPRIMGILNLTPDSFSDGGAHPNAEAAIAAGLAMRAAGADIVDVGGESTRPGAAPVPPEEEQARILPVIAALARAGIAVSADTRNAATMAAALDAGAAIINDISALTHDPESAPLLARRDCAVVLMHMRGDPATMSAHAHYNDVTAEVATELRARVAAAERAGIARSRLILDPGFGFAKHPGHSIALLRGLHGLMALDLPILVGVSRKGFIGALSGEPKPARRDVASLAAALFALTQGAAVLRVHDVAGTSQAVKVWRALTGG